MKARAPSPDLIRIQALPRRSWRENADVKGWTRELRTRVGTMTLRELQAAGLAEAQALGGLFVHGRVGVGKTLLSGLLGVVLNGNDDPGFRIVIVVPGSLRRKTEEELAELRLHWRVPRTIKVITYSMLARAQRATWLRKYKPHVIIADEAHALKNVETSAAAIRMQRHLIDHPACFFCCMSGSLSSHGDLEDFAHLMYWALRQRSPLPLDRRELKAWGRAINGTGDSRVIAGAESVHDAITWLRDRMADTPGVIISDDAFTGVALKVDQILLDAAEPMRDAYSRLRELWEMPDGWSLGDDQFQVAAAARQFANGFSYRLDPRPSEEFLRKRKRWARASRAYVERGTADSEGAVKLLVQLGRCDAETTKALREWERIARTHSMRRVADWHSGHAIKFVQRWVAKYPARGIVWVQHIEIGEALERATGCTFFRGQDDRDIRHEDGTRTVIASISANAFGKNLQKFCFNLIMDPPANGLTPEQLLGRSHREGQTTIVRAWYRIQCREHRQAILKSISAADRITGLLSPQKLAQLPEPPESDQDHPAWLQAQTTE